MEKLNATKHYAYYPEGEFKPYLSYGFRPIFLLLAPYMVINILLWACFWAGLLPLSFLNDPIKWHIYELLYGVGSAGIIAFLLTGLPEMFPKVVPIVGKKLALIVLVWILGRVSFWLIDFINIYLVAILNIAPLLYMICYAFKPVVLDKRQRHSSIAYTLVIILSLQIYFFSIEADLLSGNSLAVLNLTIGVFLSLILLALRRINTEAVNEWLESKKIDDVLVVKAPRYNLAIFTIILFSLCEFFYPQNSVLAWLGLACAAAILGTLSEYKMDNSFILFEPYVLYLSSIIIMMALGYGFIGFYLLNGDFYAISSLRHFLTIGAFGIAFFMVLVIVSFVHTGRNLKASWFVTVGVLSLVLATIIRVGVVYYPQYSIEFYTISSLLWIFAYSLYFIKFYKFLLKPRVDGIKG